MSNLSYENRVAIVLGVCVVGAVVLLAAFFFIHKNAISDAQLSVPAPDIDLSETKRNLDEFREQSAALLEQEQNTPLQDITQEQ